MLLCTIIIMLMYGYIKVSVHRIKSQICLFLVMFVHVSKHGHIYMYNHILHIYIYILVYPYKNSYDSAFEDVGF